jgi:hypothetical protein
MSDYVYDGTSLPGTKTNQSAPVGPSNQQITASEFNTLTAAVNDLRDAVLTGNYHGLVSDSGVSTAPSGQARLRLNGDVLEVSRGGLGWSPLEGVIDVRRFDVRTVESGMDDCTTGLIALRTFLRANDNQLVYWPPGEYKFWNNRFLKGVKNSYHLGYGAKWRNTFAWVYSVDGVTVNLNGGADQYTDSGDTPTSAHSFQTPNETDFAFFATVAAKSDVITCNVPAKAGNFAAGDEVFICGFAQQESGYPPNNRYTERNRVKSVDAATGEITLFRKLRYSYDTAWMPNMQRYANTAVSLNRWRWNEDKLYKSVVGGTTGAGTGPTGAGTGIVDGTVTWDYAGDLSADATLVTAYKSLLEGFCGPPMIIRQSRVNDVLSFGQVASFDLTESVTLEGFEMLQHPTNEPHNSEGYSRGNGSMYMHAADNITLIKVRCGVMTPSLCTNFTVIDCNFVYMEVDKSIGRFLCRDTVIARLTGGTGALSSSFEGCVIQEYMTYHSPYSTFTDCDFFAETSPQNMVGVGGSGHDSFVNCRFHRRPGYTGHWVTGNDTETFTVLASPAPSLTQMAVAVSKDWKPLRSLRPGTLIYRGAAGADPYAPTATGILDNFALVKSLTKDPTSNALVIEGQFSKLPVAGEVFRAKTADSLYIDSGCREMGSDIALTSGAKVYWPTTITRVNVAGNRLVLPIPRYFEWATGMFQAGSTGGAWAIYGRIRKVLVDIQTAGVAADQITVELFFEGLGSIWKVNAKTAGIRMMDEVTTYGAVSGDTWPASGTARKYVTRFNLMVRNNAGTEPNWSTWPYGQVILEWDPPY